MKHIAAAVILICLALLTSAQAATAPLRLPVIGHQAQLSASLVQLIGDDSTFVSAAVAPGGCVFLSYIDRAHGNRLHVVRDAGDHVVEIDLPPIASSPALAPAFVTPGEKQADGALIVNGGVLSVYYTSRAPDDPSGPFRLYRLSMPAPPCG
jgi:hypothetical protein